MVIVAQPVRAPLCGSGGRGFESRHSPHTIFSATNSLIFFLLSNIFRDSSVVIINYFKIFWTIRNDLKRFLHFNCKFLIVQNEVRA